MVKRNNFVFRLIHAFSYKNVRQYSCIAHKKMDIITLTVTILYLWLECTSVYSLVSLYIYLYTRCHRPSLPLQQSGQLELQWGAGPRHVDRATHGARRLLQELWRKTWLGLRVCHGGQPEIQGGAGYSGESPGDREWRHWGTHQPWWLKN